ncbi:hypothetical protein AGR6A_pTi0069 [Agrobacterium sp. NCPPB 925]|nr:hypothetical protein AGR6A_pTi0069 [Agrobacterium sp. NCPPB 925]
MSTGTVPLGAKGHAEDRQGSPLNLGHPIECKARLLQQMELQLDEFEAVAEEDELAA